jgi:hypothetical protein
MKKLRLIIVAGALLMTPMFVTSCSKDQAQPSSSINLKAINYNIENPPVVEDGALKFENLEHLNDYWIS